MAGDSEQQNIHTVEISKTAATVLASVVATGLLGIAGLLLNLSVDIRGIGENGRRIDKLAEDYYQHARESQPWIYRIIGCENNLAACCKRYESIRDK